jgi:hypothetical protein
MLVSSVQPATPCRSPRALTDANVVLQVESSLRIEVLDERIADALGVSSRRSGGVECINAREGEVPSWFVALSER